MKLSKFYIQYPISGAISWYNFLKGKKEGDLFTILNDQLTEISVNSKKVETIIFKMVISYPNWYLVLGWGEGVLIFLFFVLLFFIYGGHSYLMRKIKRKYLVWCDVTFDPLSRPRWSNVGMLRIILPSVIFSFQYKSVKNLH